jgi:hypothetical protein
MSQHFVSRFGNQFVSSVSFNGATSTVTAASFVAQPGHTYQVIWNLVGFGHLARRDLRRPTADHGLAPDDQHQAPLGHPGDRPGDE